MTAQNTGNGGKAERSGKARQAVKIKKAGGKPAGRGLVG